MKTDLNKWFISGGTALKCPVESFKEYCKAVFGAGWYDKYRPFRLATFEEYFELEYDMING